ncbi:MAG: NmrA family NAD(P)-binding protein [Burkholderiales bacterium]|nr:NmrA family NAD(P)-binding protein [Burkholderiales bacterium]
MIAITGAGGVTGRAVIAALKARGVAVCAVVTRASSAAACRDAGADRTALATFADRAALVRAFAGAATVFHIPPRMKPDEVQNGRNVIDAAVTAGVRTIALHSVINSQVSAIRFHNHKRAVEELAMHAGLPWRIFQPTNYMQNVAWNWERMIDAGEFVFPYSADSLISWLDLDDYAEAVARVLTEPGWDYGVYEMASAKTPLTRHELAAIWSRVTGRAIRAVAMPLDAYMALPHWAGRDPREMAILRTMFEEFDRHGAPGGNWRTLALMLGREPTQYEAFARRFAQARGLAPVH